MKTPPLLFSLPLFIGVLAAQAPATGVSGLPVDSHDPPIVQSRTGLGTTLVDSGTYTKEIEKLEAVSLPVKALPRSTALARSSETPSESSTAQAKETTPPAADSSSRPAETTDSTTAPAAEETPGEMPEVSRAPAETRLVNIRGRRMAMDILTDRIHIRPQHGREFVQHVPGTKNLKETDVAATLYDLKGMDRADLITYRTGRPRKESTKLLITRRVCVRLAEGVSFSAFAKNSGAIVGERTVYAEEALILTYVTALEALDAVDRLKAMPGVLGAHIIVAQEHLPEFIPTVTFFSGGGPEYSPLPLTDNVDGWQSPPFLYAPPLRPTSAYEWWANSRGPAAPPPLFPIPTEPTGMLLGGRPVNSVPCRVDLGDFAPIGYNAQTPKFQGEMCDVRVPLAWENLGDFDAPISGRQRKVLIIDDGIQANHPDLANAVDLNTQRHWNYFTNQPNTTPFDLANDSHGTALAGIVGARIKPQGSRIAGVAPGCTFHGAVVLKGQLDDFEWADAFAFAAPPASGPNGGPPEGNNRGTLKDTDRDNDYLDEDRTGIVFFEVCLNAQRNIASEDASDMFPEDWLWKRAIRFSATRGSALRGVPFVTSAGNGRAGHMDANYMEVKNSIYQIPVGGVSELGRAVSYSVPGAPIVCVAPTWGEELPPYLNWPSAPPGWPSNRPFRKNAPITPDDLPPQWRRISQGIPTIRTTTTPTNLNTGIEFNFNGTSASAAMVAGVVALMLEANPSLQARDVKEILLRSSRVCGDIRVDRGPTNSLTDDDIIKDDTVAVTMGNQTYQLKTGQMWRMSPLGRPVHHVFGAGVVDADKAVKMAKKWKPLPINPLPPIKRDVTADDFGKTVANRNTETGGLYFPVMTTQLIPTDGRAIEVVVPGPPAGMRLEHIEVRVQFYHKRRGDLEITLVAPGEAGWEKGRILESELFVPHREDYNEDLWSATVPELRNPMDWTFTTVRHWGTLVDADTGGVWKVRIRDAVTEGPNPVSSANNPVVVPSSKPNPTDAQSQRIAGVGITYHGTYGKAISNSPPEVTTSTLRYEPGSLPRTTQLTVDELGRDLSTGEIIFPVTSWDIWRNTVTRVDGTEVPVYTPMQPTAPPVDFFEFFPPQARDAVDPTVHLPIAVLGVPWPLQPFSPMWVSFQLDPAARPATWPDPPTEGPVGALTQRPRWLEMTPDELWMILRDERNPNAATNFVHLRLNRRTGQLEVIPLNKGKYRLSVYAENMVGMSKPQEIEITVTAPGYDAWADVFWDPPELASPAWQGDVSGWLADPDADGIMNGLEYALRLNPQVADAGPIPAYRIEGNEVVFSYTQDQTAVDATLHAQVSEDLETWADVQPVLVGGANGLADYEYRLPLIGDPRLYFRLWSDYNKNAGNP